MITIFAGAGASKAVNSNNYPTTIDFLDQLPNSIKDNALFTQLQKYYSETKQTVELVDIEITLWGLKELVEFFDKPMNASTIIGHFIQSDIFAHALNQTPKLANPFNDTARIATKAINDLINNINVQVYSFYGQIPETSEINNNWKWLLEGLLKFDHKIDIFTTNYDMIIEQTFRNLDSNSLCIDGRTNDVQPILDISDWQKEFKNYKSLLDANKKSNFFTLTKLHGSIDWILRNDKKISVGLPDFVGDHSRHIILYPGFKGAPIEEPFSHFHSYLEECLRSTSVVLFIGSAFRDEYINNLLKLIPNDSSIYIIDPIKTLKYYPLDRRKMHHIKKGFNKESVSTFFNQLMNKRSSKPA